MAAAAAGEIRLELAIIARLLAKHNSQPSLLDAMRMCTELHRYTELSRELYSAVMSYRAIIQRVRYVEIYIDTDRAIPSHRVTELCKTIRSKDSGI